MKITYTSLWLFTRVYFYMNLYVYGFTSNVKRVVNIQRDKYMYTDPGWYFAECRREKEREKEGEKPQRVWVVSWPWEHYIISLAAILDHPSCCQSIKKYEVLFRAAFFIRKKRRARLRFSLTVFHLENRGERLGDLTFMYINIHV